MSHRKPFVGMSLLYCPGHGESVTAVEGSPLAATVALVREDGLVNLSVLDSDGRALTRTGVRFVGPDEPAPDQKLGVRRGFCTPSPSGPADMTTCLADLAARLENVEAGLAEAANRPAEVALTDVTAVAPAAGAEPPTLEEQPAEDEKKRTRRGHR